MSPRLMISTLVVERLKNLLDDSDGQLLGLPFDSSLFILELALSPQKNIDNNINGTPDYDLIQNLPAAINQCGVFKVSSKSSSINDGNDLLENIKDLSVILNINPITKEITAHRFEDGSLKKFEYTVANENILLKSFLHLRVIATIPLSCDFQSENLQEAFDLIHKKVTTEHAAFHVKDSNVYIFGDSSDNISGINPEASVKELFLSAKESTESRNKNDVVVLNVNMYLKGTNNDTTPQLAPVIKYLKKVYKHAGIQLQLDTLAMISMENKVKNIYSLLVDSVCRNLALNEESLLQQLKSDGIKNVSLPQTYHFFPKECGHFLSIVYPSKKTPEQLKGVREAFHLLLSLPMDKPLFRQGNAYDFCKNYSKVQSNILLNPHEGLGKSGVPDGECCLVQGIYSYHHYMQDQFDDNGWGCAYRSLQTIFSWFRHQGYTNMPVPTHKDIQQCLVNIGDKPASFVGSKQWIGSTEVSFVLDTLLGITCRIVSVSSGEEMLTKGGELCYHFKTQGTPIMIGGGVLAHTIIGVDYNKKTGAMKFLILDPHYTGSEDLKTIQSKGWCGWKGPEFWKKDAFYNMCLPLKPRCV